MQLRTSLFMPPDLPFKRTQTSHRRAISCHHIFFLRCYSHFPLLPTPSTATSFPWDIFLRAPPAQARLMVLQQRPCLSDCTRIRHEAQLTPQTSIIRLLPFVALFFHRLFRGGPPVPGSSARISMPTMVRPLSPLLFKTPPSHADLYEGEHGNAVKVLGYFHW